MLEMSSRHPTPKSPEPLSRLSYVRVTRIGSPATGTSRSTKETVKLPNFMLSRTTAWNDTVCDRPAVSLASSRTSYSPLSSSVGSKRVRTPSTGDDPAAKRVQFESPSPLYSIRQPRSLALATLPTMSVGVVTTAPSTGDVISTAGGGPTGAAALTVTITSSLAASAPSVA